MAEIIVHGQVVGRAADASQFEYKPTVQVEWGHLQPGVFRYLFIPRNQLKDGDDDDSSVSSFSDSDDSEHRAEKEMKEKLKKDQEDRENADSGTRSRGLSLMSRFAHSFMKMVLNAPSFMRRFSGEKFCVRSEARSA